MQIQSDLAPARKTLAYSDYVDSLCWRTAADPLLRDGLDHFEIDRKRFQRAQRTLGNLEHATLCDIGSFPGYGLWAFRSCKRYIGLGKCPDWFRNVLRHKFDTEWVECDLENPESLLQVSHRPDIVVLQEVIEHIRKPKALLTVLHAWMRPAARLYLTTNNLHYIGYILKLMARKEIFHPMTTEDSVYPGHCTYYSLDGLARVLEELGYVILSSGRVNFLPHSRFYKRRGFALAKNVLAKSFPVAYATHLEILCEKR
jgi:hypothetical protein